MALDEENLGNLQGSCGPFSDKIHMVSMFGFVVAILQIVFTAASIVTLTIDWPQCFFCLQCTTGCAGFAGLIQFIMACCYVYSNDAGTCIDDYETGVIVWWICTV